MTELATQLNNLLKELESEKDRIERAINTVTDVIVDLDMAPANKPKPKPMSKLQQVRKVMAAARKADKVSKWTPEKRAAQSARLRAFHAKKKAGKK